MDENPYTAPQGEDPAKSDARQSAADAAPGCWGIMAVVGLVLLGFTAWLSVYVYWVLRRLDDWPPPSD